MTTEIFTCPAYTINKPSSDATYKTGDQIGLPFETKNHGTLYKFFQLGTIAGQAEQDGEDVAEAVADCERRKIEFPHMGHKQAWAFSLSTMVSAESQAHRNHDGFEYGQTITLDGNEYRIEKAANENIELIEV